MLHVLIKSKDVNIIISRRKKNDDTCGKLEVGSPVSALVLATANRIASPRTVSFS